MLQNSVGLRASPASRLYHFCFHFCSPAVDVLILKKPRWGSESLHHRLRDDICRTALNLARLNHKHIKVYVSVCNRIILEIRWHLVLFCKCLPSLPPSHFTCWSSIHNFTSLSRAPSFPPSLYMFVIPRSICLWLCMHVPTYTYIHMHIHIYTDIRIHVYTCIYIYVQTCLNA